MLQTNICKPHELYKESEDYIAYFPTRKIISFRLGCFL